MAKYSNTVEYNINTKLDSSGLTKLQAQIKQLENSMQQMSNRELLNSDKVQAAKTQLEGLNTALTNSFNSSLGILDLSKFRAELDASGVSAAGLQSAFNMMGAEGQAALNGLTTQIANFNGGMERTSSAIDKVFTTFSNTFRWGLISSFFSNFMNSIHQSVDYVKELDDSLTQIMLVTDYNRDSMNQFAKSANEAAKAVSMTTTGMTNASLIFAQQGYNLNQSQELATLSAKLANASQQDTATTSDQITAYMNAYGLQNSIEELTQQMDNWALIANVSAADVGELAQASQRAASMANAVGVSGEQLAAQIATIESVTREAPEQIGNGLKTLYARFSDIEAGGEDEEGFTLGKITSQLDAIGVQILDQFGNIRDVGDIMEDLMVIWDDLDQTSKVAASQALAGKYQVNRFMALMDNSGMYQEYKGATGSAAAGTLDQMSEEYADSIAGRSAKLQASLEGLFSTIFNTDDIYPWMDAAQGAISLLQQFFDALGGGKTVLLGITSLLTQAFSQNIARSINDTIANRNLGQIRKQNIDTVGDTLTRAGIDNTQGVGKYIKDTADQAKLGALSDAQYDTYMNNVQQWANASTALTQAQEELTDTINVVNMVYGKTTHNKNAIFNDEGGVLNTQLANDERANLSERQLNRLMQDTDFSDVAVTAKEFSQSLQNVEQAMKKVNADSENYDEQMNNLAQSIDLAGDKLAEFNALNVASDDMIESILGDLTSLETKIRAGGGASEEAEKEIAELISMIGRLGKSAKDMNPQAFKQAMLGAGDLVDKKKSNVDFAQTQTNRAEENALDAQKNINSQQQIKGVLDTLNAVQQLTFAWQAFQNLGSLWANEDLSTGEKVLQTIMNLTMAMPQLITAMQALQGNSFLQNIGNGLMGALNGTLPTIGDFEILAKGKESTSQLEFLRGIVEVGDQAKAALGEVTEAGGEFAPQLLEMAKNGDEARKVLGEIGPVLEKDAEAGEAAKTALDSMSGTMGKAMAAAAAEGATGLGVLGAGLKAVAAEAWAAMTPLLPFIAIGTAIAGVAYLIGQEAEKAKQAHEEALTTLEDAKNVQQQIKDLSSQIDEWQSKRNEQGNTKELAQDADALADSLKELGNEEEASAIHLAAIRAEALSTSKSFEELDKAMEKAQFDAQNDADLATMEAANAILKDRLSTTEELAAANETMQSAALDYNLRNLAQTNGWEMGVLNTPGDNDIRAATADWQSLNHILEQSVPGFAEITDENERLSLALAHTSDEAQRAAIQIQQMLNASDVLSEGQKTGITRQLEGAGFSAQEALQVIASLNIDEETSYNDIVPEIQDIIRRVNEDKESLSVVLQAKMDPEQIKETVQSQLAAYEPKDEDVESEDFQSLSNMFMNNADKMGEEGTPFADYSEDLLNNAEALEEVVEGILRYDDAIQSIDNNLENWQDALENSNDFSKEHIDAVQELQETYADFLDLAEDMGVSEEFAANADNLELMENAANGVEGAYEDLAQAAAEDILIHANVDDIDGAKEALNGLFDYLNSDAFSNLNIGDALDLSSIEDQINSLADTTGWTAEQMAAYLNSIGINIDPSMFEPIETGLDNAAAAAEGTANHIEGVVEGVADTVLDNLSYSTDTTMTAQTDTQNDQVMYTNLTPHPGFTTTIASTFPVGSANPTAGGAGAIETQTAFAHVTGVQYSAEPVTESQVKEMTGYGVKSEVKKGAGTGGGGVHLKKGATGSKGSRGTAGSNKSSSGSRPSTGSSGKGSGGGGGGSKAKTIQPKEKKDHQKDYYEEVNGQLNKTEKILSKIEKEEDRLIGDKARANQNKQLKLLQKEIDLNNKKLGIQKQELSDVDKLIKEQDKLAEKTAKNAGITDFSIPDVILDADGIVSNYEQISKRIDDIHNDLINKYNEAAAAGNEELTKQLEKTISQFDKYGESLLKGTQRHNELKAEIEGTIGELENLDDAIEDIRIDAWKDSTEAIDNLKELRENAAELEGFFSEYESDSPFRALIVDSEKLNNIWSIGKEEATEYYNEIIAGKEEALKKTKDKDERAAIQTSIDYFKNLRDNLSDTGLNNGLLGYAFQDLQQLQKWYENPKAKDNPFGDNTAALRDAYNESLERFQQLSEEAEKTAEDYRDDIIDAYDYIEDQQDRQIDKFDRVIDRLEHFSDMYALYYGDESYDMMRDVLQQQGNTLREQLNQQKTVYEYWVNQYAQVLETGDEKLIQEIEDKMNDAADKIAELAEDAAKTFADSYENAVKASVQHMNQAVFGDKNLNRLERNWEWDKEYIEKYRDDVEKAYEMDKLRNKYTDLLNQAQGASLQTQDKIRAQMQEQLALLDGQKTVSEYDVKLANAKLEILQKQIALEDAQRNKNQMKLRRDTQGNYRYVYTANQNDVAGAQQDLLNSEYDAYEISKNQQIQNYDDTINTWNRFQTQLTEIWTNANLTSDQKLQESKELYDRYGKSIEGIGEDIKDAMFGTVDSLNWMILNGTEYTSNAALDMLNTMLDEQGRIKDETEILWIDNATFISEEVIPKISGAVAEADEDIRNRLTELESNLVGENGVIPHIVSSIEGEDGLTTALNEARTSTDGLAVSTENLMEKLAGNNESLAKAQAELQEYVAELNNVKNASSIAADTIKKMQKQLDQSEAEKLNYLTDLDKLKSGKYEFDNKGNVVEKQKNQSKNISNAKSQGTWSAKDDAYQIWMNGKWGGGGYWYGPYKADGHTEAQADAVLALFNSGYGYEWMDTGGYTGTWKGNEGMSNAKNGKLAVLHQKELVLNSEDTKNILAAVDIVRQIGTGLRNSVSNMNLPFGKALNTIGNTIEQRVEITASFPNATDADDIRQALIGLSDKAYQYAHRTI